MIRRLRFAVLAVLLVIPLLVAQAVSATSHTAVLSALSLAQTDDTATAVDLSPAFDADTTSYTAVVYDALNAPVDEIAVTATADPAQDSAPDIAKAVIKPDDADGDTDGHQVSLDVGENTIEIVVTSAGGESTRTYMVKVTRVAASDATLSALSLSADGADLSPKFDADTEMYTASVANSVATTDVTATATHTGATATVIPAQTGATLNVGENTIKVVVRAADGTTKTYTIVVTKAASDNAKLATLTVSDVTGGALTPAFDAAADPFPTSYSGSVANSVTQVTVAATSADTEAEDPVISPADVNSVDGGHQVNLAVGKNTSR